MFISTLKGQSNVTVVGEETGGGYYGNTAMHLPVIELPASHLKVVLPMYRLVIDSTRTKNGRGIIPDVYIPPSSVAIKKGYDIKLQRIRQLIIDRKKAAALK
jgi:C-terminal processing protease CtpA/Prc